MKLDLGEQLEPTGLGWGLKPMPTLWNNLAASTLRCIGRELWDRIENRLDSDLWVGPLELS